MERRIKFNNVPHYVCVPQYENSSIPLEVCGEMLNSSPRIGINPDRGFRSEIDEVIDRLQDCNVRNLEYYVCAICTCRTSGVTRRKTGQENCSEGEESDDEGLDVEQLVNILNKHRYKTDVSHGNKALLRLISSFSGKGVTDRQLNQIIDLLTTDTSSLKEATLMFIHQLCLNEETAVEISKHSILMEIFSILSSPNDVSVQIAAFKTVEKLYCYESISDSLSQHVEECLLPAVLRSFYDKCPMAVKYSAACLLRSLSIHKTSSGLLGQELLLILKEFKDSSAKLKEVFTEIIVNLYRHQGLVDTKLLDRNLLPTCSDLIREGPCSSQVTALSLLSGLLDDEQHILSTINYRHLVPTILNCIQLSDCRKVREAASYLLQLLTRSQSLKIANEFMKQTAMYFLMEEDDGDHALVYPVLLKHQTNEKLWHAMDQLVMLIVNSISKEVEFTKSEKQGMTSCYFSQRSTGCLTHLLHVLYNICVWPIEKEKFVLPKSEIDDICEDEELRSCLTKLNRQTTLDIWQKGGSKIFTILRTFSEKLQTHLELGLSETESPRLNNSLTEQEYELVENILMIVASISVAMCHKFDLTDMKPKKPEKPAIEKQIWINDNPYLTGAIDRVSAVDKPEDVVKEQQMKEVINQTRKIRKSLHEQNLYNVLSPFLESQNTRIRVLVSVILRCCVQPVDELTEMSVNPRPPEKNKPKKTRPQSAVTPCNSRHKLELALHGMSPSLESSFRKTLGLRPASASIKSTAAKQPLTQQSKQSAVQACGPRLLKGIFSKSRDVKKSCLLLLQDIVKYGTVETHMELSQLGCIPKLVDFLRINEDDEMLEISGLILTRMLISSDVRLKQLFNRHGGARMLMAMTQYTKGKLKEEVRSTLQEVTRGGETVPRPMSAPATRPAPDVWDHIMGRWKKEDEVVDVLRQWITDKDKKNII